MKKTITAGILFTTLACMLIAIMLGYLASLPSPPVADSAGVQTSTLKAAFNRPPTALAGVRPFLGRWPTRFRATTSDQRPLLGPFDDPATADGRFVDTLATPYVTQDNWSSVLLAREFIDATNPAAPREPITDDPDRIQLQDLSSTAAQTASGGDTGQLDLLLAGQALADSILDARDTPQSSTNFPAGLDPVILELINSLQFYPAEQALLSTDPVEFLSSTTAPSMAQQDASLNEMQIQQNGELNSLALLLLGENNRLSVDQSGVANGIGGIAGESAFEVSGINSTVTFQQIGNFNQIYGLQETTNSIIRVRQIGQGNVATITQRN